MRSRPGIARFKTSLFSKNNLTHLLAVVSGTPIVLAALDAESPARKRPMTCECSCNLSAVVDLIMVCNLVVISEVGTSEVRNTAFYVIVPCVSSGFLVLFPLLLINGPDPFWSIKYVDIFIYT